VGARLGAGEIGNLLPNNQRQRRTCYALCHIMYPVSAAQTSIFRMDSNSTSYCGRQSVRSQWGTTSGLQPDSSTLNPKYEIRNTKHEP
jgi:hypothetical protein